LFYVFFLLIRLGASNETLSQLGTGEGPFGKPVVGVDEVGRGAVAGPLLVCAVRFHSSPEVKWRDSKQMSPLQRKSVFATSLRAAVLALDLPPLGILTGLE